MATATARVEPRRAAPARARPAPRGAPRRRTAQRPRVAGSVAWIVVVATLLAGIVALNVAVLRLNVQAEELEAQRAELAVARDTLEAQLSQGAAAGRIETIAVQQHGLTHPVQTSYVRLARVKE